MPTSLNGLHVLSSGPPGAPVALLVHGSLDRARSFRRTMRRLPALRVIAYDRRGYGASGLAPGARPYSLHQHVDDLLELIDAVRREPGAATAPVTVVGHSYGGDVAIGAALADPVAVGAVAAFEPPMPWLGFRRGGPDRSWPAIEDDPAAEAERFFRRMVSDAAWERLPEHERSERRRDGPALVADLLSIRTSVPPYDVTTLEVPSVFGRGGPHSAAHHRQTVQWLADHVPGATMMEIDDAMHGAHLTHADAFAALVSDAAAASGALGKASP